jgi:VanZ family protein
LTSSYGRNLARALLALSVLGLLYLSLYPLSFSRTAKASGIAWRGPKLDSDWVDMAANFAGYIPVGFLGVAARRRRNGASVLAATILAATLSLGIELAQMYLPQRDSNFRDLLLDTMGALAGSLGAILLGRFWPNVSLPRLSPVAILLILLWVFWQMFPFFPLLKRYKLQEFIAHLSQWHFHVRIFGDIALAGFSLYAFAALPEWNRNSAARFVAAILLVVLLGQSVVTGITYSNVTLAAAAAGLLLALFFWNPQRRVCWIALATALAGWAALRGLDPLHLNSPGIRSLAGEAFLFISIVASVYRALTLPSATA